MQRRLNTRFLLILTVGIVGGMLALVVGGRYLFRGTAEKHLRMAELYVREGRLADAAEEYKAAISLDRRNPETFMKLGETMRQLTRTDPLMLGKDKQYWTMALELDPSYLPAMRRLLDAYLEDTQVWQHDARIYESIRDTCTRILTVDPTDARALANLHISWLQRWMVGVETPPQQIDDSMRELAAIQQKDPSDVEVPYVLARAKALRARTLLAQDRGDEASAVLGEAESVMQQAVESNPDNARCALRQGQVLNEIAGVLAKDPARRRSYRALGAAAVNRGRELARPEDPAYFEVNMAAAAILTQEQKNDAAEAVYRELLDRRPDDRMVRIALAQLMASDPAKRRDAIDLLDQDVADDQTLIGARVQLRADLQTRTQIVLAGLRIDAYAAATDESEKTELKARIDEHLKVVYNRQGESCEYLRLKGRFHQAQNQYVDAIQTYNRAAAMLAQLGQPPNDDMMYQLARVYMAVQQTGEARNILEDLVRKYEAFTPARLMLCRVLLDEGNTEKLAAHLRYLEQNLPNDPKVTALLLAASARSDPSRSRDLLARLPESSREERLTKARAAFEAGLMTETQRLAEDVLRQTSADEEAAQLAVQSLLRQTKPSDAQRVLDAALAANPESRALRLLKAQIDGGEQLVDAVDEDLDRIPDEFTRELAKARMSDSRGKAEEALGHLARAEQIKPDAPELWDQYFQCYARQKQWDKLRPYMERLVAANHDRAGGLLYEFRLAMAKGEVDRAIDIARQLTGRLPEFAQSWLALAQGLQSGRKYDEAREAYLRVLEKQAANFEAYRGLVQTCYALRQYDDAGRHIAEARRRMPNNPLLRQMEIEHELTYGQPEKVIGMIEAQAAQQQARPQSWTMLGRAYERIMQRKAAKAGDEEVRKWNQRLREHYGKASEKWPDNSEFAARYAEACIRLNANEDGEKALLRHAEKVPGKPEPLLMLAEFYTRTNQPDRAEAVLRKGTQQVPSATEFWQRLAALQVAANQVDQAISTLDAAPDQDQVLTQKLEFLLQARKTAQAKEVVKAALARKGEDFALINAQAYIALQENDLKAARAFSDKSLGLKPGNPIALHQRAVAKLKDAPADIDGAILDLKVAMQQAPQNVELRMTSAEAYLARRDRDGAIREMEAAAALAPRNRVVWAQLIDLYLGAVPRRLEEARALVEQVRAAGGNDLELTIRSANVAALRKDIGAAIAEMRRAIEMSGYQEGVVHDYMVMLVDLGQNDVVLQESEQLLTRSPDAWWVRHVRATAKARLGLKDDALAEWATALSLADKAGDEAGAITVMQGIATDLGVAQVMPRVLARMKQDIRWAIFGAWLYQAEKDWKNAVALIEQATSSMDKLTAEEQTRAMQVAGAIYLSARPPMAEKALATYTALFQRDPEDLATLNNLACLYMDNLSPSNPAKALEFSQRAYDIMRRRGIAEPLVMDTHGWVLIHNNRAGEGVVLLQEVVQRSPFLEARYHLSEAYLAGNYASAAESAVRQLTEAQAMIADMEAKKVQVDPAMRDRIAKAMARAEALTRQAQPATKP